MSDLAYAAGLFEGEGSVGVTRNRQGIVNGTVCGAKMTDCEPLERLVITLGGKLYGPYQGTNKPLYQWNKQSWDTAREVYDLIGEWLSPRRKGQFEVAIHQVLTLEQRTIRTRANNFNAKKTHCPQGHPYDEVNTGSWKAGRVCKTCKRERARERRNNGTTSD